MEEEFLEEDLAPADAGDGEKAEKQLASLSTEEAAELEGVEEEAPAEKAAPKEKAAAKPAKASSEVKAMEKELESLRQRVKEREDSERYWYEKAKERTEAPAKAAPVEEEDPFAKESVEELISALGTKGRAALVERGFVTQKSMAAEIKRLIAEEAPRYAKTEIGKTEAKLQRDAEIMGRFPDLKNQDSPFFQESREQLKALVAAGHQPDSNTLERAAERAETVLLKRQLASGSKQSRIDQQMPSRGERGGGFEQEAEEPSTLGPEQLRIMKAWGVKPDEFRKYQSKPRRNS